MVVDLTLLLSPTKALSLEAESGQKGQGLWLKEKEVLGGLGPEMKSRGLLVDFWGGENGIERGVLLE